MAGEPATNTARSGFVCTGCGVCCRTVGRIIERYRVEPTHWSPLEQEALSAFPYEPRSDGRCPQLGEDGRCAVYLVRPFVCRVEAMSRARGWSAEETWAITASACDTLQDAAGVPKDSPWRVVHPSR